MGGGAQHGSRCDAHRRATRILHQQGVGDRRRTLPAQSGRADIAVGRPGRGAHVPAVGGVQIARGFQMPGDQCCVLVRRGGGGPLDRRRDPPMQENPIRPQLSLVGHRADQWVAEHVVDPDRIDEPGGHEFVDARFHTRGGQQVEAEPGPDDGGGIQRALGRRFEPVDAGGDRRLHRCGHADVGGVHRRGVGAAVSAQHTALRQVPHDLLGEERVTGGPGRDRRVQLTQRGVRAEQFGNQCRGLRPAERIEDHRLRAVCPREVTGVFGAVRDQDQRGRLRDHGEEVGQHGFADAVDPMCILDDVDRRCLPGCRRDIHQRGQPTATRIRVDSRDHGVRVTDAQQVVE